MDTIKTYLEAMFRNLPNTEKVLKAKQELLQMMEDKYTELKSEGKSDNEAVGTVISEFGNLEEVAEVLGIGDVVDGKNEESGAQKKSVSLDEAKKFIKARADGVAMRSCGIACLICCVIPTIIFHDGTAQGLISTLFLFILVALGVCLVVSGNRRCREFSYISSSRCSISQETTDYVFGLKHSFRNLHTLLLSVGIFLIVLSSVPSIIWKGDMAAVPFFLLVGGGVGLIVYSSGKMKTYRILLGLNDSSTVGGSYEYNSMENAGSKYNNKTVAEIMSVYWITVTCIYLSVSFLTFSWEWTWIIWPLAAIGQVVVNNIWGNE